MSDQEQGLSLEINDRDLELISGPPTARQLKQSVDRVQLLRMAMRGLNASEAAKALGIGKEVALHHYRSPDFQKEVMTRVSNVFGSLDTAYNNRVLTLTERIQAQAEKSFEDLVQMLEDDKLPLHLRVKVNQDFLDRCEDTKKESQVTNNVKIDASQLLIAAQVALEMDPRLKKSSYETSRSPQVDSPPSNVVTINGTEG